MALTAFSRAFAEVLTQRSRAWVPPASRICAIFGGLFRQVGQSSSGLLCAAVPALVEHAYKLLDDNLAICTQTTVQSPQRAVAPSVWTPNKTGPQCPLPK